MATLNAWQRIDRVLTGLPWGDGSAGNATISSDPNTRVSLSTVSSGQTSITVGATSLSNGDVIMLHQTRGTGAGQWEINRVSSGGGTTSITLSTATQYSYTSSGASVAQVIKVPLNDVVTVNGFTPTAWNGTTGGIAVILGKTSITVSGGVSANGGNGSNSTSDNSGGGARMGFGGGNSGSSSGGGFAGEGTGGASARQTSANGNGGGGGENSGDRAGAGGGHASAGQTVSTATGGSAVGSSDLTSINFGGGGGGGRNDNTADGQGGGGGGGGIIIYITKSFTASAVTSVNGGNGGTPSFDRPGGGAGAGGSILVVCETATLGTNQLTATAGTRGGNGPTLYGGTASAGIIALHYATSYTGTTNPTLTATQDTTLVEAAEFSGGIIII